jgi:hypothetical protein
MLMLKNTLKSFNNFPKPLAGDWLVMLISLILIVFLFQTLWTNEAAAKLQIRLGNTIYGTYSLQQNKTLHIHGNIGIATIEIKDGSVRFRESPCNTQYCVHQGWLNKAGQAAICLPNQLSLELVGVKKNYDSLSY